jgi:hypothetical protein
MIELLHHVEAVSDDLGTRQFLAHSLTISFPHIHRHHLDSSAFFLRQALQPLLYLYISYHCVDEDIWATMTRRHDHLWEEEAVEVFLDADGDRIGYVEIEVNPLNTLLDLFTLNWHNCPAKQLFDWDSQGICHAVCVDGDAHQRPTKDSHWSVEIAIPWENFVTAPHLPPQVGDVWLMNLYHIERSQRGEEFSAWSPTGVLNYHVPDRFGEPVFVE